MPTLFEKTGLPLWVYIVLIVVGSVIVLGTVAFLLRCWFVRRKARQRREYDGLTGGPMRRVTLRRGRVVPTSQHLSLTGSVFGMRQFGMLADNESAMTGRRSPFEWWNTIVERSQSRQDQMSQLETGSISTRPASRATTLGGSARREYLTGTPTLRSEKSKEAQTRTWEVTLPSPSPSPSPTSTITSTTINRPVNFSRSFSHRGASSPLTQRSQITLSRISERSAHQSMISTNNGPISSPTVSQQVPAQNRVSYHSAINPLDNTPFPGQLTKLHQLSSSNSTAAVASTTASAMVTPRKSTIMTPSVPPAHFSSPRPSYHERRTSPPTSSFTPSPPTINNTAELMAGAAAAELPVPKPVAYRSSASSTYNYPARPLRSEKDSTTTPSPSTSSMDLPPGSTKNYWFSRQDLQDLRGDGAGASPSPAFDVGDDTRPSNSNSNSNVMGILTVPGKNNTKVLRKKSLRRT